MMQSISLILSDGGAPKKSKFGDGGRARFFFFENNPGSQDHTTGTSTKNAIPSPAVPFSSLLSSPPLHQWWIPVQRNKYGMAPSTVVKGPQLQRRSGTQGGSIYIVVSSSQNKKDTTPPTSPKPNTTASSPPEATQDSRVPQLGEHLSTLFLLACLQYTVVVREPPTETLSKDLVGSHPFPPPHTRCNASPVTLHTTIAKTGTQLLVPQKDPYFGIGNNTTSVPPKN